MSVRLYDLGVECVEHQREKIKMFAWPIAAWKCYIPNSLSPDINILEKMVLMLVSRSLAETKGDIRAILCDQIGMNSELVKNVIDTCIEKYMDKRHSKLVLNENAKKLLASVNDGISLKADPSESMKSVYLFEDLISRRVIPCFSIGGLPTEYLLVDDGDYICIGTENLGEYSTQQPKTAIINDAIRKWARVKRELQSGESEEIVKVNVEEPEIVSNSEELESDDELEVDVPEDEITIETPKADGTKSVDFTLQRNEIARIAIYDDRPTKIFVKGYFAFDPDYPDEAEILSPFGRAYNEWFRKIVRHHLSEDENFRTKLQQFRDNTIEQLKGRVAFKNDLEIALFDEFPLICNDHDRFGLLKKSIEDLSKSLNKLLHGENEAKHFAGDLRIALDVLFKCAVKSNPCLLEADNILAWGSQYPKPVSTDDRKKTFNWRKSRYETLLSKLASRINLDRETLRKYKSTSIFKNLENDFNYKSDIDRAANTKDLIAMILIYVAANPSGRMCDFAYDFCNYLDIVYDMTLLGNSALHSGNANISTTQANTYYAQFETIVRIVYAGLMEEQ